MDDSYTLVTDPSIVKTKSLAFSSLFVMVNLALVSYTAMMSLGKNVMSLEVDPITSLEFSFFRSFFLMLTSYMLLGQYNLKTTDVPKGCIKPLIFRCLVGTATFIVITVSL
jgi:hypothetical protein